ncbi:hypothetical protein [Ureaplasma diversum]|nr:hypothetical protein [Ureaplasma diversum]
MQNASLNSSWRKSFKSLDNVNSNSLNFFIQQLQTKNEDNIYNKYNYQDFAKLVEIKRLSIGEQYYEIFQKQKSALFLVLIAYWHSKTRYLVNDFLHYDDLIQNWGFTKTTLNRAIKVLIELDLLNTNAFSKYKCIMIKTHALASNSKTYVKVQTIEDLQILVVYGMYALVNQKQLEFAYNKKMQLQETKKEKIIKALNKLQTKSNEVSTLSETERIIENHLHISNNLMIGSQYQIRKTLNHLFENSSKYKFSILRFFDKEQQRFYSLRVLVQRFIETQPLQITEREWEIYEDVKQKAEEQLKYIIPEKEGIKSISDVLGCYMAKVETINTLAHNAIKRHREEQNVPQDNLACIKQKSSN